MQSSMRSEKTNCIARLLDVRKVNYKQYLWNYINTKQRIHYVLKTHLTHDNIGCYVQMFRRK